MRVEYRYNDATGDFELVEPTDESNILSINSMLSNLPPFKEGQTYVGIDFGTSTTVVSIASYNKTEKTITVEQMRLSQKLVDGTRYNSEKLPTVIAKHRNNLLVGEGAARLKYKLQKGKDIWYSFKMEIGEDLGAKYYNSEVKDFKGVTIINPKDCVKVFFMYLKMLIVRYCTDHGLSTQINYAISIPASFEANQRKDLMEALETNGMNLTKQSLIDEPNAAFISYVHESQSSEKPLAINNQYNPKVMVFDFGGGTCDISILEIGKSVNGLYSKNIAISKFTKLGGDDVDRYITYHYLLPRFLENNNHKITDFITNERFYIATQLYQVAERLKVLICKALAVRMDHFVMPSEKDSANKKAEIKVPIEVNTSKGKLTQFDFYLSYKEMSDAMTIFLLDSKRAKKIRGEDDYNNIYMPINSAIQKANIDINELDYILLIGGSAQSPYIQESLYHHFPNSTILVPKDLQTHVSQGAAIHSLLMNGMNKCIIQPITSEPIFVITKEQDKMVMPAGTLIPSDTVTISNLRTAKEGQTTIELPICVGNRDKILYNLKISREGGFPKDSTVTLTMEINADKLLQVSATCRGVTCMIEPQNPFANKELTNEERVVLIAERKANIEAERNGGRPSKQSLEELREAYENAGNEFKAAETYDMQHTMYPGSCNLNNIAVLYHNSGNYDKAIEFYKLALEESPESYITLSNIGHTYYLKGDLRKAEEYLLKAHEIAPYHGITLIKLAKLEQRQGKTTEAKQHKEQAYEVLKKQWDKRTLGKVERGWFSSLASELGHYDVYQQVKDSENASNADSIYNADNLTTIS